MARRKMGREEISPLIYVIILNWNGKEDLEYCIPSILATKYPNFRILLVDNGSSDDSVIFVRQRCPFGSFPDYIKESFSRELAD